MAPSISHPLPDHPEFSVIKYAGCREYRVRNRRVLATLAQLLPHVYSYPLIVIILLFLAKQTFLTILYESVILLPPHGIQLETHRGFPGLGSLFSSKHFISSTTLEDIIINEGLSGWNVLYYLAMVKKTMSSGSGMDVAFQVRVLPSVPLTLLTLA
ncbi:hypothetical protein JR316_0003729 [Psilocybe cubensis]|uniref:Uncharacterized protein n=1 Tax=Psilocybe cubensis TaxID=181762 RepID=A0ACB8HAL9_PSICU|nr:hypothetical protein JR316_0003729 [Psilocybe cubensis]KAH9484249.1 hypothetical protein JR316_0003729 [Psilocybe cubensis]